MTVPKYSDLYGNVLSVFSDETEEYKTRQIKEVVADSLNLSREDRYLLKDGTNEPLIEYRIAWTLTYLKKAGLLESKRRGYVNITEIGLKEFQENPNITEKDLYKFQSFVEFKRGKIDEKSNQSKLDLSSEDNLELIFNEHNLKTSKKLFNTILKCENNIFKKLISDLLLKLDYCDINLDSNFKGVCNHDSFGLYKIAIQASNSADEINVSDLQEFAGFIISKGLTKGIFISTSSFNSDVLSYIKNQANLTIVLIDGEKLVELMTKNNLGTKIIHTYEFKDVDGSYFIE